MAAIGGNSRALTSSSSVELGVCMAAGARGRRRGIGVCAGAGVRPGRGGVAKGGNHLFPLPL
eukprot:scaffold27647_cov110-Isochrysis_galbana.AAC.2